MKIIKSRLLLLHSLLFTIILMLQSCYTVRNVHNDGIDLGFFNSKGEGSVGVSFDINDETAGASGNFMISPANNLLIGAALSTYSYKVFHNGSNTDNDFEFNEDDGQLKGYKLRGNVGYYNNFGRSGTGYFETMLTLAYGGNNLRLNNDAGTGILESYDYNPFSVGVQVAAGKNMKNIGLMGGMKFQRYFFDKQIPVYRSGDNLFLVDGISFFQMFYGMRFGGGPIKGNMQIGIGINPKDEDFLIEPDIIPHFSFGVSYVFGRKVKAEEKSF